MSSQSARDEILNRIKNGKPEPQPLPEVPMYPFNGNHLESFVNKLISFDGRVAKFKSREDALNWLKAQPDMDMADKSVYSSAPDLTGNFTEADLSDLRNAHKIHTFVTEGLMGVGETGSIWVTDQSLGHAACALLALRLYVLLDSKNIEGGLHQAYAKLKLRKTQYGSFFTGPSATADIEAVHVTGAQGPLALTALIYNCADAPVTPELIVNPNADASVWNKVVDEPD